ncbi:META domain-containing protein [Agarivorans sp. QJM3NY_29]|uniref:META domain-containing protein n=1 Tax=unclassified Agarivorans TaxID=2636026 RepID=UPI003D7DD31E
MKNLRIIYVAILLGLSGCVSHQSEGNMNLANSRWYMSADDYQIADIKLPAFHLEETQQGYKISGTTGCNNFFASASWDGKQLSLTQPIAMTRMICAAPLNKIEMEFMQAVEQPIIRDGETLRLTNGAVFKRIPNKS